MDKIICSKIKKLLIFFDKYAFKEIKHTYTHTLNIFNTKNPNKSLIMFAYTLAKLECVY